MADEFPPILIPMLLLVKKVVTLVFSSGTTVLNFLKKGLVSVKSSIPMVLYFLSPKGTTSI